MHMAESWSHLLARDLLSVLDAKEVILSEAYFANEISDLDNVGPIEIKTVVLRASVTNENGGKPPPTCEFSHKSFKSVAIVEKLYRIKEVPHPLREVLDKHEWKDLNFHQVQQISLH